MIFGIGTDIVMIERVRAALERTHGRLVERVLGPRERAIYEVRARRNSSRGLAFLASRFAAKEACSKAIGLGMRWPMSWRAIEILNHPSGRPQAVSTGALTPWLAARGLTLHVTLTDEKDYAVAFAIAECADNNLSIGEHAGEVDGRSKELG